ncbi:MAG: hypothetical protein HY002_06705 [Candidatus Rokubacteria bacterium]|nr:hypothetical protein [Candidatus Rokubacteria bacterium]
MALAGLLTVRLPLAPEIRCPRGGEPAVSGRLPAVPATSTPGPRPGPPAIPGDVLVALATRVGLTRREWQVVALILGAGRPLSARRLAAALRLPPSAYSFVKRLVRELVRWRILARVPGGLVFQGDPSQWGPPEAPGAAR